MRFLALAPTFILALLLFLMPARAVHAKTWEQAIQDVEALLELYMKEIERRTGERPSLWQGAMNEHRDSREHICAILGRRHGFAAYIGHLEAPQPPLTADTHDLELNLPSLSNWLASARALGRMNALEKAKTWNLECVGKMGIPNGLWLDVPDNVWFEVSGQHLLIYGDILPGFADRLIDLVVRYPEVTTISLGSGGGYIWEAMEAGRFIREMGLDTQLYGSCESACPLVFMGGVNRNIFRNARRFGFHKVSRGGVAVDDGDDVYRLIRSYVYEMGGNGDLYVQAMLSAEPNDMQHFPAWFECRMGLGTWYQGLFPGECPRRP